MDEIQSTFEKPSRNPEVMKSFGYRHRNQFSVNESYRRPKELEWLESLRQYKGLYDPDVHIDINNSKVYPKITRSKINIVLSRLHEMLFPETDKNWEILPTPEPRISKDVVMEIAKSLVKMPQVDPQTGQPALDPQTGQPQQPILPTADELKLAINKFAKETCARMETQIDDQFTEMDYPGETKKVLRSGLMYGTGVMKGPMIKKRTKRTWEPDSTTGDYSEKVEQEDVPDFEFVRVWDFYPDMSVTEVDKADGFYERHIFTKHDLRGLIKRPDFYGDVIKDYMREHPDGDYVPKNWETDLQVIEIEAGSGKNNKPKSSFSATDTGAPRSTSRQMGKRYEVLEYWGYVDGHDLEACGLNIDDVELEYEANVWLLGQDIIKAVLMEKAIDEYKVFYYEKDETSIFGEGLARIMRHSQLAIAGAARMTLDNGACVSGPQIEVNWSLMTANTDLNSIYPRKIWYREGRGVEAQYPAIRSLQFDSHIPELLSIIDAFKQFADEETTLPTWMIGQQVNNETAQATSGRMGTITISIKDVVKNFDTFTEKIIRDLYAWNMEFNPRQDIKGDYLCKARGVSSLVMKEVRMQALNQLATTLQPEDWVYIDRGEFLKERFKAHDLLINIKSQEEVDKATQSQKEFDQKMRDASFQNIMAEIQKTQAQAAQLLARAKSHNVDAEKNAATPIETTTAADPRLAEADLMGKHMDLAGKAADIQRQDEAHSLDMQHKDESHAMDLATTAATTSADLQKQALETEHGLKMDEKTVEMNGKQSNLATSKPKKQK